jgi:hypothetical protein
LINQHRHPVWSDTLTKPIAARIPRRLRRSALLAIKAVHTAAFALIAGCILLFTWDAIVRRPGHRSIVTSGIAFTEVLVYASNNQVCPLTPLAEELGAESGTVSDLFLPEPISRRIPVLGGSALLVGLAFHLFGWWDRRRS